MVARGAAEEAALDEMASYAAKIGVRVERWDRARLCAEEPALGESITAALCAPDAGVVNPYEMAVAALNTALANGAEFKPNTRVTSI